jgi:DNA excision repair protein ERCC-4
MTKHLLPIIIDTREQTPFLFAGYPVSIRRDGLEAGDYSVSGFERRIALERKSLDDLLGCLTHDRERFERELARMRGYDVAMVVVESPLIALRQHRYKSRMDPEAAEQSWKAMMQRFMVPFHFAADRADAELFTFDMLRHYGRDRWKELSTLQTDWQEAAP